MYRDLVNKSQKGQSILEILIAVTIFGIMAVSLSLPVSSSLYLSVDNKNISTANTLARSYLKDVQDEWKLQSKFDNGILVPLDNVYTDDGIFAVTITTEDIETNDEGFVILRRINISYTDNNENVLCNISHDYNRPGNV